jgi:hypothetical protein
LQALLMVNNVDSSRAGVSLEVCAHLQPCNHSEDVSKPECCGTMQSGAQLTIDSDPRDDST